MAFAYKAPRCSGAPPGRTAPRCCGWLCIHRTQQPSVRSESQRPGGTVRKRSLGCGSSRPRALKDCASKTTAAARRRVPLHDAPPSALSHRPKPLNLSTELPQPTTRQRRWVRAMHAQVDQRVHGAQLCRQRARETVGGYIPAPHNITAVLSPHPGDGAHVQARWVRAHAQGGQRVHGAQLCRQRAR
jgi:hypothetical protein